MRRLGALITLLYLRSLYSLYHTQVCHFPNNRLTRLSVFPDVNSPVAWRPGGGEVLGVCQPGHQQQLLGGAPGAGQQGAVASQRA